jgi:hypothetical protein
MLALMQQNQIEVPRQRVDLYRIFTQTLLERRSEVRGTPLIPETQAIVRPGPLALRMQETTNSFLHENDVIASLINTIRLEGTTVDPRQEADAFLYKLRVQIGIFALRAGDYYGFFHRTFQEYFTARSLLHTFTHHPGEISSFTEILCKHHDIWREPFLLAIAYASGKNAELANTLLHLVLSMPPQIPAEEQVLHLQIAIESLSEAKPASIDPALERQVAELALQMYEQAQQNRMFERCAHIEELIARWLSCFPEHLYHSTFITVLCATISQSQQPTRQHAALTLQARIIAQHDPWPASVLASIIPPLLAIAGLPAAGEYQPAPGLRVSADLLAKDLALINLSLPGIQGPAGFLPASIQHHFNKHPEQLHTLVRHSVASGVLLTPTIIPRKDESNRQWPGDIALQQWLLQRDSFHTGHEQHRHEDLCLSIHQDLLAHAEEMRYPLTLHMIQVLAQAQHHPEQPWQHVWQDYLSRQMNAGQTISYQESALLWGTLFQELADLQKLAALILSHMRSDGSGVQRYAERFLATLADSVRIQEELGDIDQDLDNQFSPHLRYWLDISEIYYIQDRQNLRIWRYVRDMHNLQNFRDMQGEEPLHNPHYIHVLQTLLLTPEVTSLCLTRLALVPFHQDEYADLLTILLGRVISSLHTDVYSDAMQEE